MRNFKILPVALLAGILPLLAGGFYLELGSASANAEAKTKNAALVARLTGCHEAEKGSVEGTAEGIVDGKRQSIPLKVIALSQPGMFAVAQQWPSEGNWVVKLIGKHPAFPDGTSAIVRVSGPNFDRTGGKWVMRAPTKEEVEQALASRN